MADLLAQLIYAACCDSDQHAGLLCARGCLGCDAMTELQAWYGWDFVRVA